METRLHRGAALLLLLSRFVAADIIVSGSFTVDPSSIPASTKQAWCTAQLSTCPLLCGGSQQTNSNTCDPSGLQYGCLCSNNSSPGLEYYTQTLPTFICLFDYQQCVSQTSGDAQAQSDCTTNIKDKCGTLDPAGVKAVQSSSATRLTALPTLSKPTSSSSKGGTSPTSGSTSVPLNSAATTGLPTLSNTPQSGAPPPSGGGNGLSTAAIAGIAVGVVVAVLLIVGNIVFCIWQHRRNGPKHAASKPDAPHPTVPELGGNPRSELDGQDKFGGREKMLGWFGALRRQPVEMPASAEKEVPRAELEAP